jgi:Lar family restriction alleviation protein
MGEQMTTQKPLPCPFCGGEKIAIAEGSTYRWAHAECGECGAAAGDIRRQYGQGTDTPEVQEAAIAEWNTRDRREIDALRDELAVILRERNDAHLALAERTRERDEARTEVERLRPAAEAWEAQVEEERMSYRYLRGWESAEARSEAEVRAKSARARAAK